MTKSEASQKAQIEADDQCTHSAFLGTHLPKEEELGKCVQGFEAKMQVHALHNTVVTFSEDISTAQPMTEDVPTHVLVRGLLPVPRRAANGDVTRDADGNVQLVPNIKGTPVSDARTVDEIVDALQDYPPPKHARVLRALMRATRPLRWSEVTPLARFAETSGEVIADLTRGGLKHGECWHRVPTSCTRIADLSWSKFSRLLNNRDADVLIDTMCERGKHLDTAFDDDSTFDSKRVRALVPDLTPIVEAEFEQIIGDFAAMRVLVLTNKHDTRGALLNHLTMALVQPSTKPLLARCAPNGGEFTKEFERDDVKPTGDAKAPSKKRERGNRVQRERISELSSDNKRKLELMELQEELHAKSDAGIAP
jgi:hypothetical protein